ncbi:MarR family transcriptional regulator [Dactylosporangium sp. AC04546]|uniref:MarR family winged helix-turn-helix transcriptional regulator n=1 Tax=Dactylosporangium sp. AC04546 TaxID=2862460 RepID=UPI001EE0019C|nr:MarR family transcriptional regulator [Dactylosporangium sp. AC04546]WVK79299.1 MarR family transcriptional regulator [Dactylosporangium sp. AC04546]
MTERAQLNSDIVHALHHYSGHAQQIGDRFAALHHLGATDLQALMLILEAEREGRPLTPGALGAELNFSSGAVTGLIDRLEGGGHVYRDRDPGDRRKVLLRYAEPAAAMARSFFAPIARRAEGVLDQFSEAELRTVHRFLTAMSAAMREHRDELHAGTAR